MNKKLLTVAVGAAIAAAPMMAAQADVKVFGHAQIEIGSSDTEFSMRSQGTVPQYSDGIVVEDRARGRFGIKAKEDLGNGMKGLAHFEFRLDTADGTAGNTQDENIRDREMMVGLQTGFGTFQFGNLKSPYKYTGGVKYDAFVATSLEARSNGGMTGFDLNRATGGTVNQSWGQNQFMSNSIAYKRKFGNMKLWVAYSPDENGDARGSEGDLSASFLYSAGNWEAFVALNSMDGARTTGTSCTPGAASGCGEVGYNYDSVKFGGKFKFGGGHTIMAQIESGSMDDNTNTANRDIDVDTLFVGWRWKRGKNIFVAQYGMQTHDFGSASQRGFSGAAMNNCTLTTAGAGEIDTDYLALGWIHRFSKKTRVFAGYRKTSYDNCTTANGTDTVNDPENTSISVGIRKDF